MPKLDTMKAFSQASRFNDFDAFAAAARSWNLEFHQVDRGCFAGTLKQCGQEGFQLGYACFGRSLLQGGCSPAGLRTLAIPTECCTRMTWRHHQIQPQSILIFPRNGELESVSHPGFEICTLSFSEDFLDRICRDLELPEFQKLVNHMEVIRCRPEDIRSLLQCISQSMRLVSGFEQGGHPVFPEVLQRDLATRTVSLLAKPVAGNMSRPLRLRDRAVNKAVHCIRDSGHVPLAMSDLCRMAKASERTLEYGFRERFGMTPKSYLLKYRLNGVHRQLRAAHPAKTKIVDWANQWGFWHMGQFAADYRKLFGELPSETLKRRDGRQ